MRQLNLLAKQPSAYGGELLKTRKGRTRGRPLATRSSMHLVLRSSKANGEWSFHRARNRRKIDEILYRFAKKYGVKILSLANVGNHLHIHIQLSNRQTYRPFIRAVTAAIAMAVTGLNRWTRTKLGKLKFWDYRPYTRIVTGLRAFLNLRDYLEINRLEGRGYWRSDAVWLVKRGVRLVV